MVNKHNQRASWVDCNIWWESDVKLEWTLFLPFHRCSPEQTARFGDCSCRQQGCRWQTLGQRNFPMLGPLDPNDLIRSSPPYCILIQWWKHAPPVTSSSLLVATSHGLLTPVMAYCSTPHISGDCSTWTVKGLPDMLVVSDRDPQLAPAF